MHLRVKLSSGPLIPYLNFCKAIADAVGPRYKGLEGVDCVSAKIYPPDVPTPIFSIAGPYPLDDADRQALSKVLVELPRLHYPMPEEEVASFMKAYASLASRPSWTPLLVTKETIRERKFEYNRIEDLHLAAIRREHRAGRLVPVGTNHVPLDAVQMGAHLTRKDAIAYLERHGLMYEDEEIAKGPKQDTVSIEAAHQMYEDEEIAKGPKQDTVPLEAAHQSHNADQLTLTGKPRKGVAMFSAEKKAMAVEYCKALKARDDKKFAKKTADKFKTSERSIYTWVKKAEKTDLIKVWGKRKN